MDILFTICGRAGSKGIKNKNLKDFIGYPLPFYTLSALDLYRRQQTDFSTDIVLNTDSDDLAALFTENVCIDIDYVKRPAELGLDSTPKVAVMLNSLLSMESRKEKRYDMVVDVDITSPLRTADDIEHLISAKMAGDADVVFSVTDSRRNPYFNMVRQDGDRYVRVIDSTFNTRQAAPQIYDMNASLYAFSPDFLKSGKGIFEGKCGIIKMMDTAVLDLDHLIDFEYMEVIAAYLFEKYPAYKAVRENIASIIKSA